MSAISWIWLASISGALFFAAAGFFAAPVTGRGRNRDLDSQLAAMRERERELESVRARERDALHAVALAEKRAAAARVDEVGATEKLARAVEEAARSRVLLDDQAMMVSRLQQELVTLQQTSSGPPSGTTRLQQDLAKCERELVAAKARAVEVTSRAAMEKAEVSKRITELEASFVRVTREYDALAGKARRTSELLDESRAEARQLAGALEEARAEARELAGRLQQTRDQVDTLKTETEALRREAALVVERAAAEKRTSEAVRDENASLRMGSAELAELRKQNAALSEENGRLRAAAFAVQAEERARRSSPSTPEYTDTAAGGSLDNASLQRFVDDVVKLPSVSAAALTDELGFLVVGVGDHTEALAAFGAYLTEAGARACGVLPMHSVQKVSIQDDAGITLTARTIASEPNELVLVTLGVDDKNHGQHERHEMERSS